MTIIISFLPLVLGIIVGVAIFFGGNILADYNSGTTVYGEASGA